jgi:hypothetical protein
VSVTNGYITLEEGRSYVGRNATSDPAELEDVITTASRLIDRHCGRHFYTKTEARTFEVHDLCELHFGPYNDLTTLTTLKTDAAGDGTYETTIAASSYQLEPFNAAVRSEPYLEVRLLGSTQFPAPVADAREDLIQITGVWGWPAVPPEVKQACRIITAEISKLQLAPLGSMGGEFGVQYVRNQLPARAVSLLAPYRHPDNFGLA